MNSLPSFEISQPTITCCELWIPTNFSPKISAFSQRTSPEIGWPCEHFCINHLYTASSALSFSALLTIFLVELPSALARMETNFKIHSALSLMSEIVEVPTPYSSASFFPDSPFFSLLTLFTLSFIVKTTHFLLGTITPKILKKFFYIKLVWWYNTILNMHSSPHNIYTTTILTNL